MNMNLSYSLYNLAFRFNISELVASDKLLRFLCWLACPLQKFIYLKFIRRAEFENIKCRIDCREIKHQTSKTWRNRVNFTLNKKSDNAF